MRSILAIVPIFFFSFCLHAQFTLDKVYSVSANITKLEKSGYKYYTMDVPLKQCRIYNLDHTLFKTFNLTVPEGYDLFDIQQVSEHLFNDDDLVEIVAISYRYNETETGWWYYTYEISVVNENGHVILNIPGAGHTMVFDLGEEGKKFLVWIYDYSVYPYIIHTNVYDLPDQSQTTKSATISEQPEILGNPFPNPASGNFTIPLNLAVPGGNLNLLNMQGGFIKSFRVTGQEKNIVLPAGDLAPGTYIINLQTPNKISQARKVVID